MLDGLTSDGEWLAWSAAWLAWAGALLGLGIVRDDRPLRAAALVVAGLAIGKAFLFDFAELTGLYRAVPIGERFGSLIPSPEPEMIFLFRLPLLVEWCERGCALEEVVFDVLTHEIGHHFGMDEETVLRMEGRGPATE